MALRFTLLLALALAGPAAHPPGRDTPDPTRQLLREWRAAIRTAQTTEDWAAVDLMARELSRLAARPAARRTHLAAEVQTRICEARNEGRRTRSD